jgi:hypothetical protein
MQEQVEDSATLEAAQPLGWQAAAIGEYGRSWPLSHADLRTDLSVRILALTGRPISPQEEHTNGHLVVAGVDGATLRLYHGEWCARARTTLRVTSKPRKLAARQTSGPRCRPGGRCTRMARVFARRMPRFLSTTFVKLVNAKERLL